MNSSEVIKVEKLSKSYKIFKNNRDILLEAVVPFLPKRHTVYNALYDVSFSVNKGETFGIIGKNGAGKSTLLKMITGVSSPTSGSIDVRGKVAALLELGAGFNQEYSGIENIYLNGKIIGYTKKEMDKRVKDIIEFADIGDYINQPVKTYSSGMFARLAFSVAINVEPEVLVVDEALSVGDVFFQNKCYKKFEELRDQGTTILFVSHDIQTIKQMCSRVLWLNKGKVEMCGDSVEVCNAYLNSVLENNSAFANDSVLDDVVYQKSMLRKREFPAITYAKESVLCDDVRIISCYLTNNEGSVVNQCEINQRYRLSVVYESDRLISHCIVGFVLENSKGVWIINCNTYINDQKGGMRIEANSINEVVFEFEMPALMRGEYIIGAAISEGTIDDYRVLTWLYNIQCIEINNMGNNSGMIDIEPKIRVYSTEA